MADRDKRIAFLPVEASDFIVTIAGRDSKGGLNVTTLGVAVR